MADILEQDMVETQACAFAQEAYFEEKEVDRQIPLTIAEAEELSEGRSFELIEGRMVQKMADTKHAKSQDVLHGELYLYFAHNPIGRALPECSVRLWPESKLNLRTPDIAVFLNQSIRAEEKYETRAPDLAIEIVSDDDRATLIFEKARLFLERGSRVVWIIFPTEKSVVVMTPNSRRWESEKLTCPELLPGFELEVEKIFA